MWSKTEEMLRSTETPVVVVPVTVWLQRSDQLAGKELIGPERAWLSWSRVETGGRDAVADAEPNAATVLFSATPVRLSTQSVRLPESEFIFWAFTSSEDEPFGFQSDSHMDPVPLPT